MNFKVTNTDKTTQRWRNQFIKPGEYIVTERPPKASYTFKVEPYEEKKSQKIKGGI